MNPETLLLNAMPGAVLDRADLPARPARLVPVPDIYRTPPMMAWLTDMVGTTDQLWRHQALALERLGSGDNVVAATGTASGKSLIGMSPVIKGLLEDPDATFLVFIPQIALMADQLARWRTALTRAKLEPALAKEINGDIPIEERAAALRQARVLLATEDTFNAWVMRNHADASIQDYISKLALVVIDEAHERKGIFGSNCAFLYRRLIVQRSRRTGAALIPLQFLALSATIIDPAQHLEALTGQPFAVIDERENGAPTFGLSILHIEGPAQGSTAQAMLGEAIGKLAEEIAPYAAIAFVDGRQAVERITADVGRDDVEPYRSGYKKEDRASIETSLRAGKLRAVVATSALELGIDVPQFTVGINLGLPKSRMSLRQRLGRAGRTAQATFAIVAPADAFTKLGTTFREFLAEEVEPSALYLENAIIQYGHARCIQDELGGHEAYPALPDDVKWPSGFAASYAQAFPGAPRPREIDQVAGLETGRPHIDFPMRRIAECRLTLRHVQGGAELGSIDLAKALREAYPGATYLQRKRAYRVTEWRQNSYEQSIYLQPVPHGPRTHPILSTLVNVSHSLGELQEGHLLVSDQGSLAEIRMQVTETVRGYKLGNQELLYRDLQQQDRRKRNQQRNYSTTGVLVRIDEPWFKGHGGSAGEVRKQVAEALVATLALERGIAASELAYTYSNIALHGPSGPRQIDDAIVIFDNVMGGTRLTAPLFTGFNSMLERLKRASELAGPEALLDEISVARLARWFKSLRPKDKAVDIVPVLEDGQRLIYAAGSIVGIRIHGALAERKIIAPQLVQHGDGEQLFYRYAAEGARTALVPHELIEPLGQDWRLVLWDPSTDTIEEIAA